MVHRSLENLRTDRRMLRRRGWISEEQLKSELDALPDVSDKIQPPETDSEAEEDSPEAPADPPAPAFGALSRSPELVAPPPVFE